MPSLYYACPAMGLRTSQCRTGNSNLCMEVFRIELKLKNFL